MRHAYTSSFPTIALTLCLILGQPLPTAAGDVAMQYTQVSTHGAMTMNGQAITDPAQAKKMMTKFMGQGMLAGAVQSVVGAALQTALSAVNPILGMAAQLVASKLQQKMAQAMTPKMKLGVTEVQGETVTTTVTTTRRRIEDGNITLLVQCDLGRLVTIDNAAHTYSVKTFDELAAEAAKAVAAESNGNASPSGDCKMPQASVSQSSDDQTDTIAGMTAHHKIETTNYTFPASCNIKVGDMKWTTERWYGTTDIPNQCSMPVAGNARDTEASATVEIPLRLIRKADISAMQGDLQSKLNTANLPPEANQSGVLDVLSHMSDLLTFTTDTQSVKQIQSDPALFDVPAGYAQTDTGPTPPPAVQGSS